MSWFGEGAEVEIGDQTYSVHRESVMKGTFALRSGNQVVARARKISPFVRAFEVDFAGRKMKLKAISAWTRQFGLFKNDVPIGHVVPTSWFNSKAEIDFPSDVPVPV